MCSVVVQTSAIPESKDNYFYQRSLLHSTVRMKYIRCKVRHLDPTTTHLIVGEIRSTEKLLSALAKGIWILPERDYLESNFKQDDWKPEKHYDFGCQSGRSYGDIFIPPFSERGNKLKFAKWSVVVILDNLERKSQLQRILSSGGAKIYQYTLDHLADFTERDYSHYSQLKISHIFANPVQAIQSEKLRAIMDWHGRNQSPVKILSYSYVTQFLTSKTRLIWNNFDIRSKNIVRLHREYDQHVKNMPVHDHRRLGSPVFGIPSDQVKKFIPSNMPSTTQAGHSQDLPPPLPRHQPQAQVRHVFPNLPPRAQAGLRQDLPPPLPRQPPQTQVRQNAFPNLPPRAQAGLRQDPPPPLPRPIGEHWNRFPPPLPRQQQQAQASSFCQSPAEEMVQDDGNVATLRAAMPFEPIPVIEVIDDEVTEDDIAALRATARKFMRADKFKAKNLKHLSKLRRIKTEIGPRAALNATIVVSEEESNDEEDVITID